MDNITLNGVLIKEIDLIQSCISRMSQHSFYLKGWFITLLALILSLTSKSTNIIFINIILIIITLTFWYLNSIFLRFGRMYRELYKWVIRERCNNNCELLYDLNLHRFESAVPKLSTTMWSNTLWPFYLLPLISLVIFLFYNIYLVCTAIDITRCVINF